MPRFLLVVLLCALSLPVFGAETSIPPTRIGAKDVLRASFVHEHPIKGIENPLRSEGEAVLAGDRGALWAVKKPMALTFAVSPRGASQMIGGFPVLRQAPEKWPLLSEIPALLLAALNGDEGRLKPHFTVAKSQKGKMWKITLTPRQAGRGGMPFQKMVAEGTNYVDRVRVTLLNGDEDTIVFSNQTLNARPLSAVEEATLAKTAGP